MTNSLTKGPITRQVIVFSIPIILSNLLQQVYSMVDSVIVGKGIGETALAAVGATGTVHFLIFGFIIGLTGGFGIPISQAYGAENRERVRTLTANAVTLSLLFSFAVTAVCLLIIRPLFAFMRTPEQLMPQTLAYFRVILIGTAVTVLNSLFLTILRSLGDSRTPMVAMVTSSVVNIGLDLFWVYVLKSGVEGTAIATVLSQVVSLVMCAAVLFRSEMLRNLKSEWKPDVRLNLSLIRIGLPVAFMNSVTAAGALLLQYFVNRMGELYVAAYAACIRYSSLFEQIPNSIGMAVLSFVGQNVGAGEKERVKSGVRVGLVFSAVVCLPLVLLQTVFPGQLLSLMLTESATIEAGCQYLPIAGVFMLALGWLFVYRFAIQGMGNTFLPMLSGFLEVVMRVTVGFATLPLAFRGIALAEVSAWCGACLMLCVSYHVVFRRTFSAGKA